MTNLHIEMDGNGKWKWMNAVDFFLIRQLHDMICIEKYELSVFQLGLKGNKIRETM